VAGILSIFLRLLVGLLAHLLTAFAPSLPRLGSRPAALIPRLVRRIETLARRVRRLVARGSR
jgi:hypothetical protein